MPSDRTGSIELDRMSLALGLICLGVLSLVFGDFALQWQPVPAWVPARQYLAYASAIVMLGTGASLLARRMAAAGSRILLVYLLLRLSCSGFRACWPRRWSR